MKKSIEFEFEGYQITATGYHNQISDTIEEIDYSSDTPLDDSQEALVLDYCHDLLKENSELYF